MLKFFISFEQSSNVLIESHIYILIMAFNDDCLALGIEVSALLRLGNSRLKEYEQGHCTSSGSPWAGILIYKPASPSIRWLPSLPHIHLGLMQLIIFPEYI